MTTITNAIKPTILISSPTPSNQFTARLPTTFLPVRTKPLSTSSKPLSVTVKCCNNPNLPNNSSDSEVAGLTMERITAVVDQLCEKNQRLKELRIYFNFEMTDDMRSKSQEYCDQLVDGLIEEMKQDTAILCDYMKMVGKTGGKMLSPRDFQRFRIVTVENMIPECREAMNGALDQIESMQDLEWQAQNQLLRVKNWLAYGRDVSR